jgi:hypothetical protein
MPWVGFELTIPASERTKTVHVLDRLATVTGIIFIYGYLTTLSAAQSAQGWTVGWFEKINWRDYDGSDPNLLAQHHYGIWLEELRNPTENINKDSWSTV